MRVQSLTIWLLYLFIGVTTANLTACARKSEKQQDFADEIRREEDSIARIREEENRARKHFEDSIAIYAWGDLKFGMTQKEVLQSKAFKGAKKFGQILLMNMQNASAFKRATNLRNFPGISATFGGENDNELLEIEITSDASWDEFNSLKNDLAWLKAHLAAKYGEPTTVFCDLESLHYSEIDRVNTVYILEWEIGSSRGANGKKTITISMSPAYSSSYKYTILIRNNSFPRHHKKKTKEEIARDDANARKQKEMLENSF